MTVPRAVAEEFVRRQHRTLLPLTLDTAVLQAVVVEFAYWTSTRLGRRHDLAVNAWNAWTGARPERPGWAETGWAEGVPLHPRQVACFAQAPPARPVPQPPPDAA